MSNDARSKNEPPSLHALLWDTEHLEDSLDKVYQVAVHKAESAIEWYQTKSRPKKFWAQILRVSAIMATALAGIIPMLSQILPGDWLNPAWASVAIAVAATALGLDRFFGFSTAWMRFITSDLEIQGRLQGFQLEWEAERMLWRGKRPSYEQAHTMFLRAAAFVAEVSNLVEEETHAWMVEFQNILKKLDEGLKVQAKSSETGLIMINVENGDQCEEGWTLVVEGKGSQTHLGKSGVVSNVYPGLHKIIAKGAIGNKPVQAESVAQVSPGETVSVDLTLS